ncbi:RDD family protein [Streptomyces smaragdinus]|nr:RDD family protein [Streptomyces smaragdinus]
MSLDQPPAVRTQPELAEMAPLAPGGLRFAARVIDALVLLVLWLVATVATGMFGDVMRAQERGDGLMESAEALDPAKAVLAFGIVYLGYFLYEGALLAHNGQTLGKRAVGIRVAMLADGDLPGHRGWTRAAVYAFPGLLGGSPFGLFGQLFWVVNSLWFVRDHPYHQCLHDKAAKTVVVRA